jgi:DNA-binding transcriptional LysR family regulator
MTSRRGVDWDDLRYVLAVSRAGNLSAAARLLGVNHSTVFRRLNALEARLEARLFERLAEGYRATAAGSDLVAAAERVETEIHAFDRRLAGRDSRLSGSLRVTAPDDMMEKLLTASLARFLARYPGIVLEVAVDNRMLSLTRREADVALRPTRNPEETLVGRRIGSLSSAVYGLAGSPDRPAESIAALAERPWIAWDEGSGPARERRWLAHHLSEAAVVYRSNSLLNQLAACRAGVGLALLPCFLGDAAPDLERVLAPRPEWNGELWLLTHPDLRHTARVRVFMDFVFEELRALRPLLSEKSP